MVYILKVISLLRFLQLIDDSSVALYLLTELVVFFDTCRSLHEVYR